jgi:thiamine-phosphate pyrophosphorylase
MRSPRVLLITDASFPDETVVQVVGEVGRALAVGTFAVQLRDTDRAPRDRAAWALRLRDVTRAVGAALIVNGDVALARSVGADGVHFGGGASAEALASGDGLWRSVAAHAGADVVAAKLARVDAVLVSPVFETPGKGSARGVAAIVEARAFAEGVVSVIALGGITGARAQACFDAGAHGVAVIRALLGADRPADVARSLVGS